MLMNLAKLSGLATSYYTTLEIAVWQFIISLRTSVKTRPKDLTAN